RRVLIGHRLACVSDEIDDNLLDLDPVHQHAPGIVIELKSQMHRQWSKTPLCEGARFLDHRRKNLYSSLLFIPGKELLEGTDDFTCPQCLLGSLFGDFLRDQKVDTSLARQEPLRGID